MSQDPMFLPDVEQHPKPGPWTDNIRALQAAGKEYPQIWHLFAFRPDATEHLARFTQEGPLSPGMRELIAAFTSYANRCPSESIPTPQLRRNCLEAKNWWKGCCEISRPRSWRKRTRH
jgi:hypothetical protein